MPSPVMKIDVRHCKLCGSPRQLNFQFSIFNFQFLRLQTVASSATRNLRSSSRI